LFVDEAGQVSLANIVATGTAARNIMFPEIAQKGGMLAYGPDLPSLYRQVTVLAHKLLQGAKLDPAAGSSDEWGPPQVAYALSAGGQPYDREGAQHLNAHVSAAARR
jgi:hypothetical protein